ncbi:MAG: hypothetical protein U9Q83_02025 [Bacteroidota bacterium]|nr:hypothetical protein [Bacteroidota bacterium]
MQKKIFILLFVLFGAFMSCNNEPKDEPDEIPKKIDTLDILTDLKNVYYSTPSPMEIASVVEKYNEYFSSDMLHNAGDAKKYLSTKAQAINLGIYSADIAFLAISGNNQYSKQYFSILVFLANELNIVEGINDTLLKSIEKNINDLTKVKELTSIAFFKSDAYMFENSKQKIATYMINGSWLESIYFIIKFGENEPLDADIHRLLIDQRLVLKNIIKVNEQQELNEDFSKSMNEILQLIDDCVDITKKEVMDPYTDSMRLKTIVEYNYDKAKIKKISDKIIEIREDFISLR